MKLPPTRTVPPVSIVALLPPPNVTSPVTFNSSPGPVIRTIARSCVLKFPTTFTPPPKPTYTSALLATTMLLLACRILPSPPTLIIPSSMMDTSPVTVTVAMLVGVKSNTPEPDTTNVPLNVIDPSIAVWPVTSTLL